MAVKDHALSAEGIFTDLDCHFADFMKTLSPDLPEREGFHLWLASALTSNSIGKGHVCLDLSSVAGQSYPAEEDGQEAFFLCPDLEEWHLALRKAPVVGAPGEGTPLVLDGKHRLYFYRYWLYETELARAILARKETVPRDVKEDLLKDGLGRMFPLHEEEEPDLQRLAADIALHRGFSVISGGPGTGKTFTVAKILALLLEQAGENGLDIALTAPTGKATARLRESIKNSKEGLDCAPEIKASIPHESFTIHRLLGPLYGTKRFRFNSANPLPYDVVVVDEASMIDLPLMAKLVEALPERSRLILLGDKDQLASVEPGAVFGDICDSGSTLADSIVLLQRNYRFNPQSGIAALAREINQGNAQGAIRILQEDQYTDVSWRPTPAADALAYALEERVLDSYRSFLKADSPEEAFRMFNRYHILCALRYGPYGILTVNGMIESMCRRSGLIRQRGKWYKGQPVMVTANDYHLKLYNGDVGILFPDPEAGGALRAHFSTESGKFRRILPTRLSACESAYAITVHKSQGSEFDHVLVLLPDRDSPVVTRELIYTAITRAKKSVEIWGAEESLYEAVAKRRERKSGLREALEGSEKNR
jgi:exodeoxyribonuclease V alpha subunit